MHEVSATLVPVEVFLSVILFSEDPANKTPASFQVYIQSFVLVELDMNLTLLVFHLKEFLDSCRANLSLCKLEQEHFCFCTATASSKK